jgi:hypothetical protein
MASVRQPLNASVVRYLERVRTWSDEDRAPRPEHKDHWEAGSHPDVVERVWDQLGKSLPPESHRVVCGTPALVHPESKVVIAIAIGTQYAMRLPTAVVQSAAGNAKIETTWSGGGSLNVRDELGPNWILGSYSREEEVWCQQAFEEYGLSRGQSR